MKHRIPLFLSLLKKTLLALARFDGRTARQGWIVIRLTAEFDLVEVKDSLPFPS